MKLKEKTLAHYHRMIEWAKKQDPQDYVDPRLMHKSIGESFYGADCPLCNKHSYCVGCIVSNHTSQHGCRFTPWEDMSTSINWEKWIDSALKEIEFLKSLNWEEFYELH